MEVSIQGPRIILPSIQQFDNSGTGRGVHLSLSLSLSGMSCIHGKVGLAPLQSSVPGLAACPGGSSRPWNAPCRADPHLWVSLGGLPTASVGAGERDASALLECPGCPLLFLSLWRGFRAPWRSPQPPEAVLASPALSASGGVGSPPLCALSHWWFVFQGSGGGGHHAPHTGPGHQAQHHVHGHGGRGPEVQALPQGDEARVLGLRGVRLGLAHQRLGSGRGFARASGGRAAGSSTRGWSRRSLPGSWATRAPRACASAPRMAWGMSPLPCGRSF